MSFIDEPIQVTFAEPPLLEKTPVCPQTFSWQEVEYAVLELLEEWKDFERRGRMKRNMSPAHAQRASLRGSRGGGRYYFRVRTSDGYVAVIYYDRAPVEAGDSKGSWTLFSFE